jgi:hypothetical protein
MAAAGVAAILYINACTQIILAGGSPTREIAFFRTAFDVHLFRTSLDGLPVAEISRRLREVDLRPVRSEYTWGFRQLFDWGPRSGPKEVTVALWKSGLDKGKAERKVRELLWDCYEPFTPLGKRQYALTEFLVTEMGWSRDAARHRARGVVWGRWAARIYDWVWEMRWRERYECRCGEWQPRK